ncbi:hypothetical protein ACFXDE_34340 [Kitasatospora sp. NPDC059408]|uniref:hypothetical protein n=1 Tax=Kitasatospora sp. NPDC059408 TaxID=3346823 RepID=UPI003683E5CD
MTSLVSTPTVVRPITERWEDVMTARARRDSVWGFSTPDTIWGTADSSWGMHDTRIPGRI